MTKEEIYRICEKYKIKNYTINDDLSIDVDGNVDLYAKELKELPLRFRYVSGYFECSWNNLTSLKGVPSSVGGNFECYSNPLESIKGIPLNLKEEFLSLPDNFTYSDYIAYCRDIKFGKILK